MTPSQASPGSGGDPLSGAPTWPDERGVTRCVADVPG
jgi:hypothetical protein